MRPAIAALLLLCAAIFAIYAVLRIGERPDPRRPACDADRVVQLSNGFSPAERDKFYHASFGSEMIPRDWIFALENPQTGRPLLDDLERFGLTCDANDADGLPIGFSLADSRVLPSGRPMIGMNCSICHVAELRFGDKHVRIDGAPSQFDSTRFVNELAQSVESTLKHPKRLYEFLRRLHVRARKNEQDSAAHSHIGLGHRRQLYSDALKQLRARKRYFDKMARLKKRVGGTPAGPGRADTWVTGRNSVFSEQATSWTSPSSYPHLWGYDDARWLTWNGTTQSGADRDVATALGMMTFFDLETYQSSVMPRSLFETDRLLRKLASPKWPADLFGRIDPVKSARGEGLYKTHCARCHDRRTGVGVDEVGTDPQHMLNFRLPVGDRPFHEAFSDEMRKFKQRAYRDNNVPQEEIERFEEERPNQWRATSNYVARPLAGIWATAPYLHNGSVPTLYDLLLPASQRPAKFTTGNREYDPTKLGFISEATNEGFFLYDTSLLGNSNQGHEYGTDLEQADRYDLLEYLKR